MGNICLKKKIVNLYPAKRDFEHRHKKSSWRKIAVRPSRVSGQRLSRTLAYFLAFEGIPFENVLCVQASRLIRASTNIILGSDSPDEVHYISVPLPNSFRE